MNANFEIKHRDGLARIGIFETNHGKVNTPTIMPVLNPLNPSEIPINQMLNLGVEIFITNAYLLYKNQVEREKAIKEGIHKIIGYNGPIMTDSGAFQLMSYGKIDITNALITKFEEDIGVDIGVFLDVPVAKGSYEEVGKSVRTTLERADEHINIRNNLSKSVLWVAPIQGGEYLDLIKLSSIEMGKRPFNIHAIGSVVPYLENYDFLTITKIILTAKMNLLFDRPVHLFGAGHPITLALSVYLGIDLFDSAAYILYARGGRYLTESGTLQLKNLHYFPCDCKFCISTTPSEVKSWDKDSKVNFLALHNLSITFKEFRIIKQAIRDGRLWNLVLQRSAGHPKLADAVKFLANSTSARFLERFTPISYTKARFFSHPWSIFDPLVYRYKKRVLERYTVLRKNLVLIPSGYKPNIAKGIQKIIVHPLFGLIPDEWLGLYPLMQHLTISYPPENNVEFVREWIVRYQSQFDCIYYKGESLSLFSLSALKNEDIQDEVAITDDEIIISLINYNYGIDNVKELLPLEVIRSRKTKQLREFFKNSERWGGVRAADSYIIPSLPLVQWLHAHLPFPYMRVVVDDEVIEFIKKGKTLFSRFVKLMDENLRLGDETLIVSENDDLLGWGSLLITALEVKHFKRGVAVKTRKGLREHP